MACRIGRRREGEIASFREAIQVEHLEQVGLFRLLRAIVSAELPGRKKAIAALRRVHEQAHDDGTIRRAIDVAISQFDQLSRMVAQNLPDDLSSSVGCWR